MIRHDTSNDKIAKIIINWCKENGFAYSFDTKNKERNFYTYPFTIDAPLQRREELMDLISGKQQVNIWTFPGGIQRRIMNWEAQI